MAAKTRFTCASKKEEGKGAVTVRFSSLVNEDNLDSFVDMAADIPASTNPVVTVRIKTQKGKIIEVDFYKNRETTMRTTEWPSSLKQPTVGNPVEYEVVGFKAP